MYIIENANILKDKQLKTCSLLIQNNRIDKIDSHFNSYQLIKMNADAIYHDPNLCPFNSTIPQMKSFQELKKFLIEEFLMKGCTTLFTYVNVSYENELTSKITAMKTVS